jgi:hypothetical protein
LTLGIICDDALASGIFTDSIALPAFKAAIPIIAKLSKKYGIGPHHHFDVDELLSSSGAISVGQLRDLPGGGRQRHCLATQYVFSGLFEVRLIDSSMNRFMNRDWQWNNPSNPTDYAHGPQVRMD